MAESDPHELFGTRLPFPRSDLYVALTTVVLFIPVVIIVNALVTRVVRLVRGPEPERPKAH